MNEKELLVQRRLKQDISARREVLLGAPYSESPVWDNIENGADGEQKQRDRESEKRDQREADKILEHIQTMEIKPNDSERKAQEELLEEKKFVESAGATEINRVLAYVKFQDRLFLHIPPSKTIPLSQKLRLWKEGLGQTAQVVDQDEKVKVVEGVSWIVREHPGLIKRLGFEVKDPGVLEKVSNWIVNLFRKEKKKANQRMVMSREDFLRKFLNASPREI